MSTTIKNIEDIAPYAGEHAIPGIRFRAAREAMGVSAWGMNVLELDPGCEGYPEHDHAHDQQEELYVVLSGSLVLQCEGTERVLKVGDMVRVPPEVTRKFVTRGEGRGSWPWAGPPARRTARIRAWPATVRCG